MFLKYVTHFSTYLRLDLLSVCVPELQRFMKPFSSQLCGKWNMTNKCTTNKEKSRFVTGWPVLAGSRLRGLGEQGSSRTCWCDFSSQLAWDWPVIPQQQAGCWVKDVWRDAGVAVLPLDPPASSSSCWMLLQLLQTDGGLRWSWTSFIYNSRLQIMTPELMEKPNGGHLGWTQTWYRFYVIFHGWGPWTTWGPTFIDSWSGKKVEPLEELQGGGRLNSSVSVWKSRISLGIWNSGAE